MRDDYRSQLKQANERIDTLESRVAHLEEINDKLVRENGALKDEIEALKERLADG